MRKGIFNNFYQYLSENFEKEHLPERQFESAELLSKRVSAFQQFSLNGFPSINTEDWKFTNLNRLLKEDFKFQAGDKIFEKCTTAITGLDACKVVFINGKLAPELSDTLPEGVTFLDGGAALSKPQYTEKIGTIAFDEENSMLALNTAFFKEFSVLHVAAKKLIEKPIHISHIFTGNSSAAFIPYRMLVLAEELSEATLIETFRSSTTEPVFISYVNEQKLNQSAVLHSHTINSLGENMYLVHHREVQQCRNSIFNNTNISLGKASLVRNDLNFRLKETGTETNLLGTYITSDRQHVDNHTLVDHQSPNCNSSELYKGIMMDRSHAVFNGKIFVRPDAQKTNAFQQNNNVLLSDQATIDSKPQLEIFADDVKCSHGSTVGQMNEEALFYLKTRGIGEETAKRILVEAFVSDVHSKITIPALKEYVLDLLKLKLQNESLITA
ncbi:Fe-S cluster assembly protein SufD [Rubrolithibacter danxiaensis]|uniref:Fe-S cluster assembly protein SufD n=1 Tax=Rubrolithibacter danxiaensis TaxID=3390805 RepID=UPI003BF79213